MFEEIKYENGETMIFRGTFFGQPVYSKEACENERPVTDQQKTIITEPENIG